MKNKLELAKNALVIACIVFIAGLLLICFSTSIGEACAHAEIQKYGSMDGGNYDRIINNTAISVRFAGLSITSLGGGGILLSFYAWFKLLD